MSERSQAQTMQYVDDLRRRAYEELAQITSGKKPYVLPKDWRPVPPTARAPRCGVTLSGGLLRTMFDRNLTYIREWHERRHPRRARAKTDDLTSWEESLPASSEGRMLSVAAHTLRWEEHEFLRDLMDALVDVVKARQDEDGFCMPFPREHMISNPGKGYAGSERKNYDRVNLTRGMIAAGYLGRTDAFDVMRKFYDWLNASPHLLKLLADDTPDTTAGNCNNGHEGHLLMYASPLGKPDDLVAAERAFVQDFFIATMRNRESLSLTFYPYHIPHSYVLLAFKAWMDHYRFTGDPKYLEGAQGAWAVIYDDFLHAGGSLAICESLAGTYMPGSLHLQHGILRHTGETCGSVFWADINHRLLEHFPTEVKYADEIERAIYNVVLANQDDRGHIRYHARLQGTKEEAKSINTCCEVMGTPFIAMLPQYIYSIADDGLFINLYAASSITATIRGTERSVSMATDFPFNDRVEITVNTAGTMALRLRMPGWVKEPATITCNGEPIAEGTPGTYVELTRNWAGGDVISFNLNPTVTVQQYHGWDQSPDYRRYSLHYGPVLLCLVNATHLNVQSRNITERLVPIANKPMHFTIRTEGENESMPDNAVVMPYWLVDDQEFTVYPTTGRFQYI